MAEIAKIAVKLQKGEPAVFLDKAEVTRDWGLMGDVHGGKGDRQVSLIENEAVMWAEEKRIHGFCTDRFVGNLSISGLSLQDMAPGTRFKTGSAILEITAVGKECFSNCPVHVSIGNCGLSHRIAFARVVEDGEIQAGNEIIPLDSFVNN